MAVSSTSSSLHSPSMSVDDIIEQVEASIGRPLDSKTLKFIQNKIRLSSEYISATQADKNKIEDRLLKIRNRVTVLKKAGIHKRQSASGFAGFILAFLEWFGVEVVKGIIFDSIINGFSGNKKDDEDSSEDNSTSESL